MVTPKAVAVFPWLSKAKTKVGSKAIDPTYTTEIRLDPNNEAHADFIGRIEAIVESAKEEVPESKRAAFRSPLKDEILTDKDTGEETHTGMMRFTAKTHATDKEGQPKKLTIVDAGKQPVTAPVFGGSEVKLIVKPSLYSGGVGTGLTVYLNAVQVLTLVTSGGADTSLFDEEEGYHEEGKAEAMFSDESDGDDSDY
jgi:hypothetical protein